VRERPRRGFARLRLIVDGDVAWRVHLDAGLVQADCRGVRCASRRNEDIAALDGPVTLSHADGDADAFSRAPLHTSRLSGDEHLDTFVAEDSRDRVGDVGILATGQPRPLLDDRDTASEAP